jgi:hypothetical protein
VCERGRGAACVARLCAPPPPQVSLEELYNGGQRSARIQRNIICPKCRGTGAKDGEVSTAPQFPPGSLPPLQHHDRSRSATRCPCADDQVPRVPGPRRAAGAAADGAGLCGADAGEKGAAHHRATLRCVAVCGSGPAHVESPPHRRSDLLRLCCHVHSCGALQHNSAKWRVNLSHAHVRTYVTPTCDPISRPRAGSDLLISASTHTPPSTSVCSTGTLSPPAPFSSPLPPPPLPPCAMRHMTRDRTRPHYPAHLRISAAVYPLPPPPPRALAGDVPRVRRARQHCKVGVPPLRRPQGGAGREDADRRHREGLPVRRGGAVRARERAAAG